MYISKGKIIYFMYVGYTFVCECVHMLECKPSMLRPEKRHRIPGGGITGDLGMSAFLHG